MDDATASKVCTTCGDRKPLDSFGLRRESSDGRRGRCKSCYNSAARGKYRKLPYSAEAIAMARAGANVKVCTTCDRSLSLDLFRVDVYRRDGLTAACGTCRDRSTNEWRQSNQERVRETRSAWYLENRDRQIQSSREWKKKNPERVKETRKLYVQANREHIAAVRKKYYENHPGYTAQWQKDNPEKTRAIARRYRANNADKLADDASRRRALVRGAAAKKVDLEVLWTGLCALCGFEIDRSVAWPHPLSRSVDHIIPLSRGGTHTDENIQWAHLRCNISKGAQLS